MKSKFSINMNKASDFIKSLPSAEYEIIITGSSDNVDKLPLYDKGRKIHLDLSNLSDLFFLYGCFCGAESLVSVLLPNSLEVIGNLSFSRCKNLSRIELPESLKVIGDYAFFECTDLCELRFSGTMAEWNDIVKGKHWHCGVGALCVQCSDGEIPIDTMYFNDEKKLIAVYPKTTSIKLPADCKGVQGFWSENEIYFTDIDINHSSVSQIKVDADNEYLIAFDDVLYSKRDRKLICCPPKKSGVLTVPKGYSINFNKQFDNVYCGDFDFCDDIKEIHFEDNRKTVGFPKEVDTLHIRSKCKDFELPIRFN